MSSGGERRACSRSWKFRTLVAFRAIADPLDALPAARVAASRVKPRPASPLLTDKNQPREMNEADMNTKGPLLPKQGRVPNVNAENADRQPQDATLATRDHEVIRRWAERRGATPATGIGTTTNVDDGGAVVRFNFPGVSRLRPISWEEWFEDFDRHQLLFVYEEHDGDSRALSNRYRTVNERDWNGQFGE